ncbi:MAG: urease accessory protein UreE [Pseudomonadota bacterium]
MTLPRATSVGSSPDGPDAGEVVLDYAARLIRRKRLVTTSGSAFLVDLAHTTHVEPGEAFVLEDGGAIRVAAAQETLLRVEGDLPRLAWHIGNRHTPCAIFDDHLLIQHDPVLRDMVEGLGARVTEVTGPFRPEGGAYGTGRVMGHSHEH